MAVMAVAMSGNAQEMADSVYYEPVIGDNGKPVTALYSTFRDNWFISVGGGAQMLFSDHDKQCKFKDRLTPQIDVAIGKWLTPSVGVRVMYTGWSLKGATQEGMYSTGKPVPGKGGQGYWLEEQKFNMLQLRADMMFDLTNIIGGYNPNRVYGFVPYFGVGWGHVTEKPHQNTIIGSFGLFNMFHVSKAVDINVDLRGTVMDDSFDGERGHRSLEGILGATVGITYRFAPRGWRKVTREVKVVNRYNNTRVNELRQEVQQLVNDNEKKEAQKVVERQTVIQAAGDYIIYFPINVSSLSDADKVQLENVAKMIESSDKNMKFNIIGYADKATGNAAINEELSRLRAESVRSYLVNNYGVNADRLNVSWMGGVDNMYYNDPSLSRIVIVSPVK